MPSPALPCVLLLFLVLACPALAAEGAGVTENSWGLLDCNGSRWLRTPSGQPFYSKGVAVLSGRTSSPKAATGQAFTWQNHFPSESAWRTEAENRTRAWGFNTRGGWSDSSREFTLPQTVELDLGRLARLHWFDPFDPEADENTLKTAREITAPFHGDPTLLGHFSDNEVGWWNTALFSYYLQYGAENYTKKRLCDLLFEWYGGDWRRLSRDFVPARHVRDFEDLKLAGAVLKLRPGGRGIDVINRFTALCAERYYSLVGQALRTAHPGALVLGDRLPLYYNQHAVKAMRGHVDVLSTNYNLDDRDGWAAPYYFEGLSRLTGNLPVLVSEFFCAARENRSGNRNNGHLLTVGTQAERARAASRGMRLLAAFPNVVGAHWFQYFDEPTGGRNDGEDFNMGLVDVRNQPYEELTGAFTRANAELETIHARAAFPPEPDRDAPALVPRAAVPADLTDRTLAEWDKPATRLRGWQAPSGFAPFGDVHLAWRPEGLSFFCLAQSAMNPKFLAHGKGFPLSEAFRLHFLFQTPGGNREYAVCLAPVTHSQYQGEWEVRARMHRAAGGRPLAPLAGQRGQGLVQSMDKPLPHIAFEGFLPARLLGHKELRPGQELRLNLWAVMFFRDMTMTWAGQPPENGGQPLRSFRTLRLSGRRAPGGPARAQPQGGCPMTTPVRDDVSGLKTLGQGATAYPQRADAALLETFPNTFPDRPYQVTLATEEFTSLCPKTGQPDFGTISIRYVPDRLCIESKSLKLYLFSFRSEPSFMETLTNRILDDLVQACAPREMTVIGDFRARGGVTIRVEARHPA